MAKAWKKYKCDKCGKTAICIYRTTSECLPWGHKMVIDLCCDCQKDLRDWVGNYLEED